jgi:hypothetical protein
MTNTIASSTRIYYEYHNKGEGKINTQRVPIPTGAAAFQSEIIKVPEDWIKPGCDLKQYTSYSVVRYHAFDNVRLISTFIDIIEFCRADILQPWNNRPC